MKIRLAKISTITILLTALLPIQQLRAQSKTTQQGVVYTLNDDHYEVTGFDLKSAEAANWTDTLVIADVIDSKPVTAIADYAFDATSNTDCNDVAAIKLGANITSIGVYAFFQCKNLAMVEMNEGLKTIGQKAFYNCTALASLTLPASLTTVGNSAFYGCRMLASLTIASDGLNIDVSAFGSCPSLYTIRFLGTPPVLGSTCFYGVGRVSSPASVYVPTEKLSDYAALMYGAGSLYSWKTGEGYMTLRTCLDGLVYNYVAPDGDTPACLQISAVDEESLVNKGTADTPAYLLQSVSDIKGYKVTDIARNAFSMTESESVFALDLRKATLSGLTVDRTTGQFAGVSKQTIVYLPAGNASTEANVIIGNEVATVLQVGRPARTITADEVKNGRATWLLNYYMKQHVFGQQIGTDATPLPAISGEEQEVLQATFSHEKTKQYRCANTYGTVTLPDAVSMGFDEGTSISFYANDDIDEPFNNKTELVADIEVMVYPQTSTLSLNTDTLTFRMSASYAERSARLTASALPEESRQEVTWSSDKPEIVSVDDKGNVKALAPGKAVITATSRDNAKVTAQCRITVIPRAERIELSETSFTIALSAVEDPVHQLSATVYPLETSQEVIWASQNEEICTVDENGLVTGLTSGKTVVTCTPKDNVGIQALCYVTVLPAANSVWISRNSYTMLPDDMEQLKARVLPSTAIQTIAWKSSNEEVATVSDDGVVVAKAPGKTTITATSVAMPSLYNRCVITVVGVGTQTTIKNITYQITALEAENLQMTVTKVPDALLEKGGEITIPDTARYARLTFDVTEVADTAIGTPKNNTLVYIPKGIRYKGEAPNVIVATAKGSKCHRLNLTDGVDFETSHTFIAEQLNYPRQCLDNGTPFPICLPYSLKSDEECLQFFDLKEQRGDSLIYYEVEETEPYKPYLALAAYEDMQLGGNNIEVGPYKRNTDVYVGYVQFCGTMKNLDYDYLAAANGCIFEVDNWGPVTPGDGVSAFSAWLSTTHRLLYTELVTLKQQHPDPQDNPDPDPDPHQDTALGTLSCDSFATTPAPIYDLRGRMVGTNLNTLPKGIYVRNGKKIVK